MSKEIRSQEARISYVSDRYRDVDNTLRLELASLPGMVDTVQKVCALNSTETPEKIDQTMVQVNELCKKTTKVIKDVCTLFEQIDPDIVAMESTTNNTVLQIPDTIHAHIRSIHRFFDSDSIQDSILKLIDIKQDIVQYAPIAEEIGNVYDAMAELGLIIEQYLARYPQSKI